METRNIIAAISLSAAVILLYTLFFAPPPVTQESIAEKNKTEQSSDAPSLDQKENIIEISCHGSTYILQEILDLLVKNGAEPAKAGEFTLRAFLN